MDSAQYDPSSSIARSNSADPMFIELWNVCAGSLANIPKEKQRVFYFPQGHMEQLQGTIMDDEQSKHIPAVNLPSKILCRVVNVMRTAEPDTDEVYAQITLQAEIEIDKTNEEHEQPESPKPAVRTFSKILTASDTSTHGGLSVNRKHATECLPQLDMSQTTPNQELVAKDLHGYEWRFRHIYRGEPRRHLFTTGWSSFVNAKKLVAGDEFVFLRGGNDDIRVGVRRFSSHHQGRKASSVLSGHSMNLAVLATASHAIAGKSLFVIYYKPRASPFIIGVDQYMEAVSHGYDVGMRVKMNIEAQDSRERRYIILDLFYLVTVENRCTSVTRVDAYPFNVLNRVTGTVVGVGCLSQRWPQSRWRSLKVQWDEPTGSLRLPDRVSPWDVQPYRLKRGRIADVPAFDVPTHSAFQYHGSTIQAPDSLTLLGLAAAEVQNMSISKPYAPDPSERSNGQADEQKTKENLSKYLVFGSDLSAGANPKKKCKQCSSIRTRTKVKMQGVAVGRSIDLTALRGYSDLIIELERMFEIKGEIYTGGKWAIVFTDNEGDTMLVGYYDPWPEFCRMVKKIVIYSRDEVKNMKPILSSEGDGTLYSGNNRSDA
ncbi:Auxin response factor 18 [Linum perenne]